MTTETAEALAARYGPSYRWLVTIAGMTGAIAMVLSTTIVNVAIPSVMGAFGVGQDEAQWLATSFLATMTASQLLNAWVIAAFGQRIAFTGTICIFTAGTVICSTAPSIDVLILGRVIQGTCAGVIQPMVMVTLFRVFPPDRRGAAMGIYGMGIMMAPMLGPMLGGVAIDVLSWRHLFLIPLPMAMVALVLGMIFMPARDPAVPRLPFDWTGYVLLAVAIFCLMVTIKNGPAEGWISDSFLITALIGLAAAVAFVYSQVRSSSPLLDFTLFRNPVFAAAAAVAFVFGLGNFATSYLIPVFVQTVARFTPTEAGLVLAPAGLALMCTFPFTGRLTDLMPPHYLMYGGLLLFASGTALMATADVNTAFWTLAFYTIIGRLGLGFIMPSLNATALRALSPERLNRGSGTVNFLRQLGGACGVNSVVVIVEARSVFHAEALTATQTPLNSSSRALLDSVADLLGQAGLSQPLQQPGALHFLGQMVEAQARTMGFGDGFLVVSAVFVCSLVPAWILGRSGRAAARRRQDGHG